MKTKLFTTILTFFSAINFASAQLDSMLYHDTQMETQWGSSMVTDQYGCFVRFTPTTYPATLRGIRVYFRNAAAASTFKFKVYKDPAGSAMGGVTQMYISPNPIMNPSGSGNANQQYTSYIDLTSSNLTITQGDFYAGIVQTVGYAGTAVDNVPNTTVAINRQWEMFHPFSADQWQTLASEVIINGQFGITAFLTPTVTGQEEIANDMINVFPNPVKDLIYVQLPLVPENTTAKIYDTMGKLVVEHIISEVETKIDMSTLAKGVYIVQINTGKNCFTRKVVKE